LPVALEALVIRGKSRVSIRAQGSKKTRTQQHGRRSGNEKSGVVVREKRKTAFSQAKWLTLHL